MGDNKVKVIIQGQNDAAAAFRDASEQLSSLKETASTVFEGLVASEAIRGMAELVNSIVETQDQLYRLSQRTGISMEDLSSLAYTAKLSDLEMQELATGIKKLSVNMAEAQAGNKQSVALFTALGVSATDAHNQLRPVYDVLLDIAAAFQGANDGAGKEAIAVKLFGKAGDQLIPVLNRGKSALADMRSEAERLGVVFGSQAGEEAERFHDNLTRLQAKVEGLEAQFVGGMLPGLERIVDALTDALNAADDFSNSKLFHAGEEAFAGIAWLTKQFLTLGYAANELQLLSQKDPTVKIGMLFGSDKGVFGSQGENAELQVQIENLKKDYGDLLQRLDGTPKQSPLHALALGFGADASAIDKAIGMLNDKFPGGGKKNLTLGSDPGEVEKMIKAQTELRKAQAAQDVAIAQGESKDELAALELLKEQGLVTLQSYYKERYDVTVGGIDAEIQALVEEVAAQQKVVDAMKKGTPEQVKAQAELVQMQTQLISKSEERGRVVQQLQSEELKGTREFGYQVAAIQAQVDESKDHSAEVAIAAIRKEYDEKRRILTSAGQDTSELDNVEQMAIAAAKAEALAKQIEQVYADMEEKVAAVNAEMAQGHITDIDGSTKANEIRGQAAAQLADLVEKYKELAAESGDPQLIANGEKFGKQIDTLKQKVTLLGQAARDAFQRGFESFLGDVENGRWLKALEDFGQAFVDAMNQILAKMLAVYAMQKLLGWLGSFGGGGGFAGGGVADAGGLAGAGVGGDVGVVPFFAAGGHMDAGDMGVVGDQGPELWVPDAGGHVVPLGGNAVSSGGTQVTVVNHVDARGAQMGFADYLEQRLQQTTETAVKRAVFESEDRRRRRP